MSSFWDSATPRLDLPSRCPDFTGYLAVSLGGDVESGLGLHPVLTNLSPEFDDVSMGGASFDVRRVRVSSFPHGLNDELFKGRDFVVVKHPRADTAATAYESIFSDIATELQILRHPSLRKHANIVRYLAAMYHDAGDITRSNILPALVLEYAELGSLHSYQAQGYGHSFEDKIEMVIDAALGLQALHEAGVIHGDVKTTNLLVAKHPTRKFIVKLTDFGFSLSVEDNRIIGFTKYLEAPESSLPLERRYLVQLDIYSYGLLLQTVMKNGVPFYEAIAEGSRDPNIPRLKKTCLLAVMAQLNLLEKMKDEKCLLLLICHVLAYTLQPLPGRRFKNMKRIVQLLEWARLLPFSPDGTENKLTEEVSSNPNSPRSLLDIDQKSAKLKEMVAPYINTFCDQDMALAPWLQGLIMERIDLEFSMFHAPSASVNPRVVLARALYFEREVVGLADEERAESTEISSSGPTPNSAEESPVKFCTDFMPKISEVYGILRKAPRAVQTKAFEDLERVCMSSGSKDRRAAATLNLACAYVNGLGIEHNVQKAASLILEAANMGLSEAQTLYATVFSFVAGATAIDAGNQHGWLVQAAESGHQIALAKLKTVSKTLWASAMERYRLSAAKSVSGIMSGKNIEHQGPPQASDSLFRFEVVRGLLDAVQCSLQSNPDLVNRKYTDGQTPLLDACKYGNFQVAELLIDHGAIATDSDCNGITPLHWLVAFEPEEYNKVCHLFSRFPINMDAVAVGISSPSPDVGGISLPINGTPLQWAIARDDVAAMDTLLNRGSNAVYEPPPIELQVQMTALDYACLLHNSAALSRLLQETSVLSTINQLRRLVVDKPVSIRPLFHSLQATSRWSRLLRKGSDYEAETQRTIQLLVDADADTESVLEVDSTKMSAVFATAYHQCNADVMQAGLRAGFRKEIDQKFVMASSGGTALFLAITHGSRKMFDHLLAAGADVNTVDQHGHTPLCRAAKESDDTYFIERLLPADAPADPPDGTKYSAFYIAISAGHYNVARYLYDRGADRDRYVGPGAPSSGRTILCDMLRERTRNSLKRVQFLLALPDRGSDGFIVMRHGSDGQHGASAFHVAVAPTREEANDAEIMRVMVSMLLRKYHDKHHLDSPAGPHRGCAVGLAAEAGNHQVVAALLAAGADPNLPDEYGRTPLDLLYWRYCYPSLTEALAGIDTADRRLVGRVLRYVNGNTSETLALLTSYGAQARSFRAFPAWMEHDSGYRSLDWVLQRLQENRSPEGQRRSAEALQSRVPVWGEHAIDLPDNPMQQFPRALELP